VHDRLAEHRLAPHISGVVDTANTGWKPRPEAFRVALEMAGCAAHEAAMVGDDLEADIEGGLAAGFGHVIWITPRRPYPHARVFTTPSVRAAGEYLLRAATGAPATSPQDT
jgi:putative hydrolase of the HAD superfamily